MRSSRRTVLALIGAFGVISFVVVVYDWIRNSRYPVDTANVVGADLAALAIALPLLNGLVKWWRKGRKTAEQVNTSVWVCAAADRLADATADRWRSEAARRRIVTPAPATVRWRWAADRFAVQRNDVAVPPVPGTGPFPLPDLSKPGELLASGVVTRLHDEVYARLPHGRLVLLGGPGAGKTGAMILLMLAALARRSSVAKPHRVQVPVPVWLTMAGWDPDGVTLQEWAIGAMNRDHPFLRAREYGPDAARELLDRGCVALFLDGLDEMPEGTRGQALRRISDEAQSLRIVMTSRTDEYVQALESGRLDNTAVVELRPIRATAAAEYLLLDRTGLKYHRWETLAAHLKQNSAGAAARALDNPLTLSLVRDVYAKGDPVALTVAELFPTPEAIRAHLIDQILVTAYQGVRELSYASGWLAWISHHMATSQDLLWWHIPTWIPRWKLIGAAGSSSGLACGLWIWLWLGFNVSTGLIYALGFGCASGLATGFISCYGSREPRVIVVRRPRWRELGHIIQVEVSLALVCVIAVAALAAWANNLATGTIAWNIITVLFILIISIPLGWLPFGLFTMWATPVAASASATPFSTYRSDCRASILHGAAVGLAAALTPVLFIGLYGSWYAALVLGSALFAIGSAAGLASGQVPMVWATELVLAFDVRRGVHFINFMEDALSRQVLRQAGGVYQFRHSSLQEQLTKIWDESKDDANRRSSLPAGSSLRLD
jgi:hypothetical protein